MTGPGSETLATHCAALLRIARPAERHEQAVNFGAHAAGHNYDIDDVVTAVLHAAISTWAARPPQQGETTAAIHAQAAGLLSVTSDVLGASISGYHRQIHSDLSQHDIQRTEFVSDLLAGRADPGHLAERAQRYGIRLSGTHVVTIAAATGFTEAIARDIDSLLAARYGSGNTLTTLRDSQLICISTGGLRGLPAELAHHLIAHLGTGTWQIAAGRPHPGVNGIATSLGEARNTLDLAVNLGFTTPYCTQPTCSYFPSCYATRQP